VSLLRRGPYRLATSPGVRVAIDRQPVRPGVVWVAAGRHVVIWTGPVGHVVLMAHTCAERRALGEGPRAL
jgi:hypothetical protein